MAPADLRTARKRLGLTQHSLAGALRMGKWGFQSVAKWEKGETSIEGYADGHYMAQSCADELRRDDLAKWIAENDDAS